MRTIAVFSVILYHAKISVAGWKLLSGGYLGVDIFFVISGYLITTLLMSELSQTGRVSILHFYERRARRLLPALLIVMLASLPFAWHYLLPERLVDFSKSLLFSLFFASNFYWDLSLQEYGAESALLKPFLHTWSLAVEEQYYIVFPLLLFSIYRWGKRYLTTILFLGLVASLFFAQWMTVQDKSFSFYMMPTRFWELLTGSLLALYLLNHTQSEHRSLLPRILPSVGLLMVVGSLLSFGFDVQHPGFITLIPVLGTALIIGFTGDDEPVNRVLSKATMVYLGLLSYSLYLWHYPIFAFGRMADVQPSILTKSVWILLTFVFSATSYHLFEKPFRSRRVSRKVLLYTLLAGFSAVIAVSLYWIKGEGIPSRGDYLQDTLRSARQIRVSQGDRKCNSGEHARNWFGVSNSCVFEYFPGSPTMVVVGDSNAAAIGESIRLLARENHYNYTQVTQMGCPHLRLSDLSGDVLNCFHRAEDLRSFLSGLERPIIVYNARLPLYLEPLVTEYQEGQIYVENPAVRNVRQKLLAMHPDKPSNAIVETLETWIADGYKLVLIYPVPEQGFGFNILKTLKWHTPPIQSADQFPTLSRSYAEHKKRVGTSYSALDEVTGPAVTRVYPEHIFCRKETGTCIVSESDRLYFETDSHVTPLGSDLIAREIAAQLDLKIPDSFRK